ncbi:hypothetical protein H920_08146 [Fukomys damarensis]|uniref:Uncharacterized protein n=1 Tax=Fukomys damarensis TaxID=885580 RepID=A0A091DJI6_FUKDA|nr:hypothetical protein H920_08146 [Fukomys damarensis]
MRYPAMFTLIASPQVNLPRLKTFTRAVYQRAPDGLENKGGDGGPPSKAYRDIRETQRSRRNDNGELFELHDQRLKEERRGPLVGQGLASEASAYSNCNSACSGQQRRKNLLSCVGAFHYVFTLVLRIKSILQDVTGSLH